MSKPEFTMQDVDQQVRQEWADTLGLGDIVSDDPEAKSAEQLAEILGLGRSGVEGRMREAIREGKAERLHVIRAGRDGRMIAMYVYRRIAK